MKTIITSSRLLRFKRKSPGELQLAIDNEIKSIVNNPEIGELKKGNLKDVRVHRFKFKAQLFLLSYEVKNEILYLYSIGSRENYYKQLKEFLS